MISLNARKQLQSRILLSIIVLFFLFLIIGTLTTTKLLAQETKQKAAAAEQTTNVQQNNRSIAGYAFLGAAIAFGFGAIGAGIGIGNVGAAAMGAIAEKPEIAGQALIFVALAEGLMVFGFVVALMILGKV